MHAFDTDELARRYARDGYCFPIDALSAEQSAGYRAQLEALEAASAGRALGYRDQLNHSHVIFRFANEIVRNERVLDAVEAVIGPDIMVWGATFFIKEPHTQGFVSWHQDLRYWGLVDRDAMVSAWLALGPVTRENGCMRFLPGSHRGELVEHRDSFDTRNVLTRGQEAQVEIDESQVAYVELQPGQFSLHHGHLLHASAPNRSDIRRVGLAINYIAPHNRQVVAPADFAMLVRGEDRYGNFQQVPSPERDLSEDALAWHARMISAQDVAVYEGVAQTG